MSAATTCRLVLSLAFLLPPLHCVTLHNCISRIVPTASYDICPTVPHLVVVDVDRVTCARVTLQ